jgi:serine phosphatase RsbU (regulator of sigma subunit)
MPHCFRYFFRYFFLILFLAGGTFSLSAENEKLKRLFDKLQLAKTDTDRVKMMDSLFNYYEKVNSIRALSYAQEALDLSVAIKYEKGIMNCNYDLAMNSSDSYDYSKAIEYFLKSMEIAERKNDLNRMGAIYNHMGIILSYQGKNQDSKKYFEKCLAIYKKKKNQNRMAVCLNNMGIASKEMKDYDKALEYYQQAMAIFTQEHYPVGIASTLNNLGIVNSLQGHYDSAMAYYARARQVYLEMKDTSMASGIYVNIGDLYTKKKEYEKALTYYLQAKGLCISSGNKNFQKNSYEGLAECYEKLGKYKEALFYNQAAQRLKDTIQRDDGLQQLHDLEKKNALLSAEREMDKLKHKQKLEMQVQQEQTKRSRVVLVAALVILLIVSGLSYFLFKSNKKVNQSNRELEEKKKEIQDSINYARNIQRAMLPEVSLLARYFPEGFGLFLPKDVVSGDFYWFNELNDTIYLAVADCTGHGVPGGFMSMIGMDKLNQILIDKHIEKPSDILHSLNKSIKDALKQSSEALSLDASGGSVVVRDGMDIAVCHIDFKKYELQYAGANRPLWIIRNKELLEFAPTKSAIGGHTSKDQIYVNNSIAIQKGDCVYMTTDGYADQFGGAQKKKLMTRELKRFLLEIHQEHMEKQETRLAEKFNTWRGGLEQVDDVLVFGVRIG